MHKFLKLKIGFMLDIVDTADEVGQASFLFVIPVDAAPDVYSVDVQASADGYENASASTTFDVIGSGISLITPLAIISLTVPHQAMAVLQATIVALRLIMTTLHLLE